MADLFTNNAEGVLAAGISNSATTITLADTPGAHKFAYPYPEGGLIQRATITHVDFPLDIEIVSITDRAGLTLTVERGIESTSARAWPAGAKVSARVTAGILESFFQVAPGAKALSINDRVISIGSDPFVVNGRPNQNSGLVQIAGWPVLSLGRVDYGGQVIYQDTGLTHEAVGGTQVVSLGTTPTWVSGQYYDSGAVVVPTTPNGFQYTYEKTPLGDATMVATEPAFDTSGYSLAVLNPSNPDEIDGYWIPTPNPLGLKIWFAGPHDGVMLTEVGFLCLGHGATTPPSISISTGTVEEPVPIVSSVSLSQIDGAGQVWRHIITDGGALQKEIRFDVTTPATGNFVGRFYWRGVAFGTSW